MMFLNIYFLFLIAEPGSDYKSKPEEFNYHLESSGLHGKVKCKLTVFIYEGAHVCNLFHLLVVNIMVVEEGNKLQYRSDVLILIAKYSKFASVINIV